MLLLLLLSTLLPRAALAAFSPDFSFFLACGANSSVSLPSDSPARTFVPDAAYLSPARAQAVFATSTLASPPALYAAARADTSSFSYRLVYPASPEAPSFLVLRLHFFPFLTATSFINSLSARFNVLVPDAYELLYSFSPPAAGVIKEFFVPRGVSAGDFTVKFAPEAGFFAFVNAVELFPAVPELLWNNTATPVGIMVSADIELWKHGDVGGPKVTKENDTFWRTWLPDGPYLDGAPGQSVVSSTSSPIIYDYDQSHGYTTREVAPDVVYQTQRAANVTDIMAASTPGLNFNVTWTFPAEPGSRYLVRLHFCDYEVVSSVVGVGIVFNVYVAQAIGTPDLSPTSRATQSNEAFYMDYAARAPNAGNLTVSIGRSQKSSGGGILNGLEIMRLLPVGLSSTGPQSDGVMNIIIVITASAVACVMVVLCSLSVSYGASGWAEQLRSRWSREEGRTGGMEMVSTKLHISLAKIKAATDNFHERNLIGVGGFGNVYKGVLGDGTPVAVKRATHASQQGLPEFRAEIVVLSGIRHRHLVSLVGYCSEQSEMILVYEHMEKGTLRSHLYGSDAPPLSWKQRLEICIGAARGLHYLHRGYAENIIHRDVKSTNILLGTDNDGGTGGAIVAKVADFGLSRVGPSFGETHVSTAVKGSFGYQDPGYFKTQQLTDRSDVYSFGVVLLEVLCARPVIDQSLERGQINIAEWAVRMRGEGGLHKIADPRIAGEADEESLRKFAETADKCLADCWVDRPSMGDVLWNLEYCLQLQETDVTRDDASDDSAAVVLELPEAVVVSLSTDADDADQSCLSVTELDDSKVFSQLSARGLGR